MSPSRGISFRTNTQKQADFNVVSRSGVCTLRGRMGAEPATITSQGHAAYVRLFSDASWALAPCAAEQPRQPRSWRSPLTAPLPGSNTPAITLLALFAAVQVLDAVMTWTGVLRFGTAIEANPLLAASFTHFGAGATLGAAKLFAIACALVLHLRSHYLVLSVLTVLYVFGAIVPWSWTLGI
jgi:hypothetical protein